MQKTKEQINEFEINMEKSGHICTSRCGNNYDCPLCEHGKLVCNACGHEDEEL